MDVLCKFIPFFSRRRYLLHSDNPVTRHLGASVVLGAQAVDPRAKHGRWLWKKQTQR